MGHSILSGFRNTAVVKAAQVVRATLLFALLRKASGAPEKNDEHRAKEQSEQEDNGHGDQNHEGGLPSRRGVHLPDTQNVQNYRVQPRDERNQDAQQRYRRSQLTSCTTKEYAATL